MLRARGLVLLLGLAAAFAAHADYKRTYAEGLDAARAEDWGTVRQKMQEALAEEGAPAAKVRLYGTRFDAYVPQYYLGLAAYKQGNCAEAISNWENAAARPIIAGSDTLSGVANAGLADCRTRLAATTPAPRPTPVVPTPTPTPTPGPGTTSTGTQAVAGTTSTTQTGVRTGTTNPVRPGPTPTPVPAPPKPVPTPPEPVAASTAPEALSRALDAYLAGRYTEVAALDPGQFSDKRARYHALLVRAAARHTQSQLQGSSGSAALAAAQGDIRAAKALAPGQQPDAALYSPRFVTLYAQTR